MHVCKVNIQLRLKTNLKGKCRRHAETAMDAAAAAEAAAVAAATVATATTAASTTEAETSAASSYTYILAPFLSHLSVYCFKIAKRIFTSRSKSRVSI